MYFISTVFMCGFIHYIECLYNYIICTSANVILSSFSVCTYMYDCFTSVDLYTISTYIIRVCYYS